MISVHIERILAFTMTFQETVLARRKELGMTWGKLASKTGFTRFGLMKMCRPEAKVYLESAIKVSKVLKFKLDKLSPSEDANS